MKLRINGYILPIYNEEISEKILETFKKFIT